MYIEDYGPQVLFINTNRVFKRQSLMSPISGMLVQKSRRIEIAFDKDLKVELVRYHAGDKLHVYRQFKTFEDNSLGTLPEFPLVNDIRLELMAEINLLFDKFIKGISESHDVVQEKFKESLEICI